MPIPTPIREHVSRVCFWLLAIFLLVRPPDALLAAQADLASDTVIAALVDVLPGDVSGTVTLMGRSGAVFARAQLAVQNLFTQEVAYTNANSDGSFSVTMRGTTGAPYRLIAANSIPDAERRAGVLPDNTGTLVWQAPGNGRFEVGGRLSFGGSVWLAQGRIEQARLNPGDLLSLVLDVTLFTPDAAPDLDLTLFGELALQPLFAADGAPLAQPGTLWAHSSTRTGVPIQTTPEPIVLGTTSTRTLIQRDGLITAQLVFGLPLPQNLAAAWYVPVFSGAAQIGDSDVFDWYRNRIFSTSGTGMNDTTPTYLPQPMAIGAPATPRLPITLFDGQTSNVGSGIASDEALADGGAVRNPVRFAAAMQVVPLGNYALTPTLHLPPALLPFVLPGGDFTYRLGDGLPSSTLDIAQMQIDPEGRLFLRPLRGAALDLSAYGEQTLFTAVTLRDADNQVYTHEGTHRVVVAEPLTLLPAALAGAPFVVGDVPLKAVHLSPPVPADVTVTLRFAPLFTDEVIEQTFAGRADAYGYFQSDAIFRFDQPGEYLLDYDARYQAADGRVWAGSLRSAGVVAQDQGDAAAIARGVRGLADYVGVQQLWFDTATYPDDTPDLAPIAHYPYFSGDVVYVPDTPDAGVQPALSFACLPEPCPTDSASPFIYISSVRPAVALRQSISAGAHVARWRNADDLGGQIGAGAAGNRPGDYAFLFGGLALRDAETDAYQTAGYASFAVIVDDDETLRVQPPFIDPVLTVDDVPQPLFLHLTGVRPGQTLDLGARLTLAGHVAPPLAATMRALVTTPSGRQREMNLQANRYGYVYDPQADVVLNEVGVWSVQVAVTYAGQLSAGDTALFGGAQRGALAGASDGRYLIFVTEPGAPALNSNRPAEGDVPPGQPLNFNVDAPQGWSNVQAYYVLRTPAYVLEQGTLRISGGSAFYQYNPQTLSRRHPQLEADARTEGAAASDEVTLTVAISGTDANGRPQVQTRTFTLRHDRLLAF